MMGPGFMIARVGSCEQTCTPASAIEDLINWRINRRMKEMYREGYRRFRTIPMPRTGDDIRFKVMGWPGRGMHDVGQ